MLSAAGEKKLCPIENQPGQWQTVEGLYTATQASTTLALHSEGGESVRTCCAKLAAEALRLRAPRALSEPGPGGPSYGNRTDRPDP